VYFARLALVRRVNDHALSIAKSI